MNRELIESKIKSLVLKFEANKYHYLSRDYGEEQVKIEFINPLFEALGWDVRNTKGLSPYEKDVIFEKGETLGHPDYNFRIDGQTKFFIEAKAPHEPLHKINHVLQAKSYAWNTKSVFIVLLTDFEEFRLFDATIKPDPKNADQGLIFELTYIQYLDNLDKLILISKEEVEKGSLDKLLLKDSESKRLRKPVDEAFLEDISKWREELAKDIYKNNIKDLEDTTDEGKTKIQVKILNEAVQKILDRLIFIRIAEDRKIIEPKSLLEEVEWWKAGGKRRDLQRRLINRFMGWNQDFNGEILKPGPCDVLEISSELLAKIIEGLYFPKCPYRFEVIGVELLGSIYERYLGKTIRVTPKRVKIEEKPEVRKAGGVYYTPQYIVDYIVKNTVGKVIKGKTPKQIEKIKVLDPACGSGSFLLTAYQTLIDYHLNYYEKHPEDSGTGKLFPDIITDFNGTKRLSIEKKAQILKNNIFGVDIDPQAVEIAMLSLYLKCLETEKDLPQKKELLPSLAKNIRCGNSLISFDIFEQLVLFDEEEKLRINPFEWHSKTTGFGLIMADGGFDAVIGNPPYGAEFTTQEKQYLRNSFDAIVGKFDSYGYFIEKGVNLLRNRGLLGYITPHTWLTIVEAMSLRKIILNSTRISEIDRLPTKVFQDATVNTILIFLQKDNNKISRNNNYAKAFLFDRNIRLNEIQRNIARKHVFKQEDWNNNEAVMFNIDISRKEQNLLDKIKKGKLPLNELCDFCVGIQAYDIHTGQKPSIIKNRIYHSNIKINETFIRELNGNDVSRYYYNWPGNKWISYGPWLAHPRKLHFFQSERILVREITSTGRYSIHATYVEKEFVNYKTILNIILKNEAKESGYSIHYVLGVLVSALISWYFPRASNKLVTKTFPRISILDMKKFPFRLINFSNPEDKNRHDRIANLVKQMLKLHKKYFLEKDTYTQELLKRQVDSIDEKINELVYDLYGITKEDIKIIEDRI